jgi:chorismate synthase
MSDGSDVLIRVAFKPTPSIARPQTALAADGRIREIEIRGRHDPVIVPRAVVVVECMAAITVLDLLMRDLPSRLDW